MTRTLTLIGIALTLLSLMIVVGCERTAPIDLKCYAAGNFKPVSSYDDYVSLIRKEEKL